MSEERGFFGRMWDRAKAVLENTVYSEAVMQKTAQGSAEIAQGLFSQSNAYVPYGHAQQPLEVEGPAVSFQQQLEEAARRHVPDKENELER